MTDLRAERRAIAAQIYSSCNEVHETYEDFIRSCYEVADDIIQHDLDNLPEWEDRVCHCEGGKSWCRYPTDDMKCGKEIVFHAADIPVSGNITINSLVDSASGWVRAADRLPTEADAPRGRVWTFDIGRERASLVSLESARFWHYWHPAVGQFQIPEPPK